MTQFEITVNETKERKIVRTKLEAYAWMKETHKILSVWGGEPTFTILKIVTTKIDINDDEWRTE